jgi:Flp pilus assembly protein CpaB
MNDDKKRLVVIIVAVLIGIGAVVMVGSYIERSVKEQTVVIAKDSEKRRKMELDAIRQEVDQKMIQMQEQLIQQQSQMANVIREQVAAQPRGAGGVAAVSAEGSLSMKTPAGKRAITISIDSLSAVGGLLTSGDYVDILAHLNVPGSPTDIAAPRMDTVTVTVFQNVEILAVGTSMQPTTAQYPMQQGAPSLSITFAVEPEETGLLTFAQKNGRLQLVLRSPQESEVRMLQAANWQTLSDYILEKQGTDISAPRSPARIEPAVDEVKPFIQIFRGGREL